MSRTRVIDTLRRVVGGAWIYQFPRWIGYVNGQRIEVYRCAHLAPRFDGDEDSFWTVYHAEVAGKHVAQSNYPGFLAEDLREWIGGSGGADDSSKAV